MTFIELEHEPHDAEHIRIAAYGRGVNRETALNPFTQEIAEVGKPGSEPRCGERRDTHVGFGFGNHGAFFRRGVVGVNQLHIGTQQLVLVEHLDAAKSFDLSH
jgi:hypothetical protein